VLTTERQPENTTYEHQPRMSENPNATAKAAQTSSFSLTPSQALPSNKPSGVNNSGNAASNVNSSGANNKNKRNNKNRRRRNGKNSNTNTKSPPSTDEKGSYVNTPNDTAPTENASANGNANKNKNNNKGKKPRPKQRQRQRDGNESNANQGKNGDGDTMNDEPNGNGNGNNNPAGNNQPNSKRKNKKRKPKKKYPWRRHIPEGTVDPITLDNLDTLDYPPFALVADEPYVPVPEWPVPTESSAKSSDNNRGNSKDDRTTNSTQQQGDVDDLNRQRLADQWGEHLLPSKDREGNGADGDKKKKAVSSTSLPLSQRPLNLFDGRALAFYMVSQLQFIDPFTRRDLTRAELQNLDRYLDRYGNSGTDFESSEKNGKNRQNGKKKKQKLRVTDAYDAKGITLSSAGAAAATAQGRADIMQQTAQQLLNTLFIGQPSVSSVAQSESFGTNERQSRRQEAEAFSLQEQYAVMQRQEREAAAMGESRFNQGLGSTNSGFSLNHEAGAGGFMIIDDDENPEMRGQSHNAFPSLTSTAPAVPEPTRGGTGNSFYSAAHITGRFGGSRPASEPGAFPALPTPAASAPKKKNKPLTFGVTDLGKTRAKSKKSKTLSKISGIVKKTTADEKQKQWDAREAARRKAMMSNLIYGMNPLMADPSGSLPTAPSGENNLTNTSASEEQIQRNQAFAEALGVTPVTQRHYASGWARPTKGTDVNPSHEHVDELSAALYSDALIVSAREHRMDFLLKLEKRWSRFLNDDKAASLPLNRMNSSARKFVHEYAEFWNLKTESFDPEPNRYIHCVKLLGTRMPHPLLSDVARNWRGPSSLPMPDATRTIASVMNDHTSQQTAGQTSRDPLEASLPRAPAPPMKLRAATAMSSSKGDLVALGEAAVQNSRSDALMDKERPQLNLLPRSVPLELPPFEEQLQQEAAAALDMEEDLRRKQVRLDEKRRREREIEQRKKQALENAFASDDEDNGNNAGSSASDSEWEDAQEALHTGSDEE